MRVRQLQHPDWKWSRWLGPFAVVLTLLFIWLTTEVYGPERPAVLVVAAGLVMVVWALYFAAARKNYRHVLSTLQRGQCLDCAYDLRGTVAAGGKTCPECGASIHPSVWRHLDQRGSLRRPALSTSEAGAGNAEPPAPHAP